MCVCGYGGGGGEMCGWVGAVWACGGLMGGGRLRGAVWMCVAVKG